jgi:hypothetical protein
LTAIKHGGNGSQIEVNLRPIRMCVVTAEGCYSGIQEKVKPKRGEPGTAPWQDLGGSADEERKRLIREQGIATFDHDPNCPAPRSPATASPEANKKPKAQITNLPFRFSKVINGSANAHTDILHVMIFPCLPSAAPRAWPVRPCARDNHLHSAQHEALVNPSSYYPLS